MSSAEDDGLYRGGNAKAKVAYGGLNVAVSYTLRRRMQMTRKVASTILKSPTVRKRGR